MTKVTVDESVLEWLGKKNDKKLWSDFSRLLWKLSKQEDASELQEISTKHKWVDNDTMIGISSNHFVEIAYSFDGEDISIDEIRAK